MTTHHTNGADAAADEAESDLARLQRQIGDARIELAELHADATEALALVNSHQAAALLEANERLVLTALHAQSIADTATLALDEASRTAELDALTALPNRVLLLDRLTRAIVTAKRHGNALAVLFLDVDQFKEINDAFGHAVGDAALRCVARCLLGSVREADTVSRHGGDEFVILLIDVAHATAVQRICEAVGESLAGEHDIEGHAITLSVSIGVSLYPTDGLDARTLIEEADAAMYRAKNRRGGSAHSRWEPASGGAPRLPTTRLPQVPLTRHASALATHEHRSAQQCAANEHLLIAALGAQGLQADAEQAQQRQTDFMTMLAHELRNPLVPLRAAATLLGRVQHQEPVMLRLQAIIERQVVNMSRLVSDLLDVSRAKTGKLRIESAEIDFSQVLSEAVDTCRVATESRAQHLVVDVPRRPIRVIGDALRLAQSVTNLLDNASKYTPNGGEIRLHVELGDSTVVMTVTDTGIGITADTLHEVFEPFVQDAHAIGFNGAGLGIGLTVVRELVEAHGGTVSASSPGRNLGSSFVMTLPRVPDASLG